MKSKRLSGGLGTVGVRHIGKAVWRRWSFVEAQSVMFQPLFRYPWDQWWARQLWQHLARRSLRLRDLTLAEVDLFLGELGRRGLSRASMVTAAKPKVSPQ